MKAGNLKPAFLLHLSNQEIRMSSLVKKDDNPAEFIVSIRNNRDYIFCIVLASLLRMSIGPSYGARLNELCREVHLWEDDVLPVLNELIDAGIITANERQIGTANIRDIYYKPIEGCTVETVLRLQPQG